MSKALLRFGASVWSRSLGHNIQVRLGNNASFHWTEGERQRLISEAIKQGRITKCKPGYTLDQGTLGLKEFKY